MTKSNIYNITNRESVIWGGCSQVKTELALFNYAKNTNDYSYYHLLYGVVLLLKPISYILIFFEENKGYEFMGMQEADENHLDRVRYYHFFVNRSNLSYRICKIEKIIQRFLGISRINKAYYRNN